MLPQNSRLRREGAFDEIFRQGKPFFLGEILVLSLASPQKTPQIGVAFKGKFFPKASLRNEYKRKMLEALRGRLAELPPFLRFVVLFQKPFPDTAFTRFEKKSQELIFSLSQTKKTI